ncbi:hypothetical protein [Haloterrigena salifodinae]|uniref:hypothetical protein n=1 Tax=Haloterrigena salifodinae TaxID=2675099 RepID=UPI000F88183E|nr:hypothetical protein [Haloterrigena salifodinae]
MSRSTTATWLDWRDPAVGGLGVLLLVNLVMLSSAVRDGSLADVSISLGVCYAIVVAMIAVSRGLTDRDGQKFAFAGGVALFVGIAFAVSGTAEYAAVSAGLGTCSVYYCFRFVRTG